MDELKIESKDFEQEVLKSDIPVLVDFWAPWCGPCIAMEPIIEKLAEEYKLKNLKIRKLNVDENGQVAEKYGVMSIPTLIIFKNGEIADQMVGFLDYSILKEKLDKFAK